MKNRRFVLFVLCSLFFTVYLYAQEDYEPQEINGLEENEFEAAAPPSVGPTPELRRLELEIRTSSLAELAAWSRSLGLSEAGTRSDLSRRLREHFNIGFTTEPLNVGQRVITIESARLTEYFTVEVVDEEYARLYGDVRLSLIDGDAIHRISAAEVLFNRTRNTFTASGGVVYVREERGTVETFRGESITVDIDNWTSVFLDGASERMFAGDGTVYSFSGRVISQGNENVTVLDRATIRNISNPEAFWSITATRIWLLPGSDFAIFNAFLRVGEIPVLYIPFFYWPADEIVFRPVLGLRSREGAYVQTTTYILGRPRRDGASQSSLTRLMGGDPDGELVREGMFLRNTGRRVPRQDTITLKALLDYYANLGAYFGLELATPRRGILNSMDLSMGIGVSRTIFEQDGFYSPYGPDFYGIVDWNRSNLFTFDVPFRYRFRMQSSLTGRHASLSWNIPLYSDPFVDIDFMDRAEFMDWIALAQQEPVNPLDRERRRISHYQWDLRGDFRPQFPRLAPFVSGFTLSNTSTLGFTTVNMPSWHPDFNPFSPSRFFFAPNRYTIYSVSSDVRGTLLNLDTGRAPAARPAEEPENPLGNIGIPRSPWATVEDEEDIPVHRPSAPLLSPPELNQRFDLPRAGGLRFSIDYRLSPTSSSELQFRNREWQAQDDVDWGVESVLSIFGGSGVLNFNFNHSDNIFSNVVSFSGSGSWRQFNFINEEADAFTDAFGDPDPVRIAQAREAQYRMSMYTTFYSYTGTIRPLHRSEIWGQSNLQYRLAGTVARSRFIGTGDNPEWEHEFAAWDRDRIQTHQLSTNFHANIRDNIQQFTFTSVLPPLESAISANATFRKWISETQASVGVRNPGDRETRFIEPLRVTETLRFTERAWFQHHMVFEHELDNQFSAITNTLNLWDFRAEFRASRRLNSELTPTGWVTIPGDPVLRPTELNLIYARNFGHRELIRDRLNFSLNVNSRIEYRMPEWSRSRFEFNMGFTLGINNFLYLSLLARSENVVIFRYFRDLPGFEFLRDWYPEGPQNNVLTDLLDSFNFFNEDRRRRSGFKMRDFTLDATHRLGDWNAVLRINMRPFLPAGSPTHRVGTDFSFLVQWVPINEIRSDISFDRETDRWRVR